MRILMLCLVVALSGCGLFEEKPMMAPEIVKVKPFHPPMPRPMVLNDVQWETLTPTTSLEKLKEPDYSYMCLDWSDYLVLGQNMQTILAKFGEYEGVLCYYRADLAEVRCAKFEIPKPGAK